MRKIYSLIQKIIEFRYKNCNECGTVFMFHKIVQSEATNNMEIEFIDFKVFISHLMISGKIRNLNDISLCSSDTDYYLTFDDIYLNAYENALSWLTDNAVPFTVFITLDYIDKPGYISRSQLNELSNNQYCTIGSHSLTHPLLRNVSNQKMREEIIISKTRLEELLGKPIDYFAYPYGSKYACPNTVMKIAEEAGYKLAFSTFSMGLNKKIMKKYRMFLPRVNVDKKTLLQKVGSR